MDSSQVKEDCDEYDFCSECNYIACTKCQDNYALVNNECCEKVTQDYFGCAEYESACSNVCTRCQPGYLLERQRQCMKIPCSINNCAYCFRMNTCALCE